MYICFGDSIIKGWPGKSFLSYVKNKKEFRNKGIGGNTLKGTIKIINKYNKRFPDRNNYILCVGANDVILPILERYSFPWKFIIKVKRKFLNKGYCYEIDEFKNIYESLITKLISEDKKIIVISIPYLEMKKEILDMVEDYNKVIKDIAYKYKLDFIDIYNIQKELKKGQTTCFFAKSALGAVGDSILTKILDLTNFLSKKRKLDLTIDGAHMNELSARTLANEIDKLCR